MRETKFCCFSPSCAVPTVPCCLRISCQVLVLFLYVFVCSAATHMLHSFNFAHDAVEVVIVKRSGFAC